MSVRLSPRVFAATALATGGLLLSFASAASAHVGTDKDEITAGESTTLTFSIGHGCDGEPTSSMAFQIPETILDAAPQVKAGWAITTERTALAEPVDAGHGEEQTERVSVITFTAEPGNEVDDAFRDSFTLAFGAPDTEGELFFKVIQGCATAENAWIEEWDGTGAEPESPAPSVMVVAAAEGATGDDHDEEEEAVTATTVSDAGTTASTVEVGGDDGDGGDDGSNGLAVAGLVVGGLGLAAGGTALVLVRKNGT